MGNLTRAVADHLYFDVARFEEEFLHVELVTAESLQCFRTAAFVGCVKV